MNLYLRLLRVMLTARWREQVDLLEGESRVEFRVQLNDLDLNMHMNNGRYFTIMDLGRLDLIARSGLLAICWRNKWMPVLGAAKMQFFRPLNPFEKFVLRSKLVGWNEKWFYIEQTFENQDGKVVAQGTVKGLFRGQGRNIPTAILFDEMNLEVTGLQQAPQLFESAMG